MLLEITRQPIILYLYIIEPKKVIFSVLKYLKGSKYIPIDILL